MINPYRDHTIFVQIASFRDSQHLTTLRDLFDKADNPNGLKVCICWQHSEEDTWDVLSEFESDDRVIVIDVPSEESKGVCWARNLIQQKYDGEDFTLHLDSHHRFVKGWDTFLKNEILKLQLHGYEKPLLTGYISNYHPSLPEDKWGKEPWQMVFDRFTPEGVVFFRPAPIEGWEDLTMSVPGRFYSGHFCFTIGSFCNEVQHDPRYYFHGEEISITLRAYTHGYDIFHPHRIVAYHEYSRDYRPTKHWDVYEESTQHNQQTYKLVKELLGIDGESCEEEERYGKFGLGKERTIDDWERYAGIRFADRSVQKDTLNGKLPPNNQNQQFNRAFKHCVNVHGSQIPPNLTFLAVALHSNEETIYRRDYTPEELIRYSAGGWINIWIDRIVADKPTHVVVWPCTDDGWQEKITLDL